MILTQLLYGAGEGIIELFIIFAGMFTMFRIK